MHAQITGNATKHIRLDAREAALCLEERDHMADRITRCLSDLFDDQNGTSVEFGLCISLYGEYSVESYLG